MSDYKNCEECGWPEAACNCPPEHEQALGQLDATARSAFDLEAAKEQARQDYGSTSAFRVGISAAKLGMRKENPYLLESRGFTHFEKGYSYWQEQNAERSQKQGALDSATPPTMTP